MKTEKKVKELKEELGGLLYAQKTGSPADDYDAAGHAGIVDEIKEAEAVARRRVTHPDHVWRQERAHGALLTPKQVPEGREGGRGREEVVGERAVAVDLDGEVGRARPGRRRAGTTRPRRP